MVLFYFNDKPWLYTSDKNIYIYILLFFPTFPKEEESSLRLLIRDVSGRTFRRRWDTNIWRNGSAPSVEILGLDKSIDFLRPRHRQDTMNHNMKYLFTLSRFGTLYEERNQNTS